MHLSGCQFPDQPGFDGAEQELSRLGAFPCALDVLQDPLYLCSGEICVDGQTRLLTEFSDSPYF
jgi:hypothetical protein